LRYHRLKFDTADVPDPDLVYANYVRRQTRPTAGVRLASVSR